MSTPQQDPSQQPIQPPPGQPIYYQQAPQQRSVAGTTMKVLLTIAAVVVGLVVLGIVAVVVLFQLT